jgi:ATP-dependent Lon protease
MSTQFKEAIPVIAIRDIVTFPNTIIPLYVGRKYSVNAINLSFKEGQSVIIVTQKKPQVDDVIIDNLYNYGVLANIIHIAKTGTSEMKVIVDIHSRVKIIEFIADEQASILTAIYEKQDTTIEKNEETQGLVRYLKNTFTQYVKTSNIIPMDVVATVSQIEDDEVYVDIVSSTLPVKVPEKMEILMELNFANRVTKITKLYNNEIQFAQLENKIQGKVRHNLTKGQQEHYLREQIEVLQKELNTIAGKEGDSAEKYETLLKKVKISPEAKEKVQDEINRIKSLPSFSSENFIIKSYLDWVFALPWGKFSRNKINAQKAMTVLNKHHYGLEKIKERIIEYIAVYSRVEKPKGQILCLYGPPGVGKTSIVSSIAEAMGKKYAKVSLGGMRDEAEIRGHRKTYVGAFPGKIIGAMKKTGVMNPVILLDEIDKISDSYKGDPAAALLEVLDPEQNKAFQDNYIEIDFDLSNVTFIATANSLNISQPLLDRMELVNVSGYTELEKVHIAKDYIIPEVLTETGIKKDEFSIADEAILEVINHYTRESGVRSLKQNMFKIARKGLVNILKGEKKCDVTNKSLHSYLGQVKYEYGEKEAGLTPGVVTGLAYTTAGGDILSIEAVKVKEGKGEIKLTGKLGDVMKESMQTAFSYLKSHCHLYGIKLADLTSHDIHIHVPEGATPKDGPSAGITIVTALVSLFTETPAKNNIAMTGEVTLQGKVLAIGGLKEKMMSAIRSGITDVIIPFKNVKDLEDISNEIKNKLKIHTAKYVDEVIKLALNGEFAKKDEKNNKKVKK